MSNLLPVVGPTPPSALKVKNFTNGPSTTTAATANGSSSGSSAASDGELAELTSSEISLDLQVGMTIQYTKPYQGKSDSLVHYI